MNGMPRFPGGRRCFRRVVVRRRKRVRREREVVRRRQRKRETVSILHVNLCSLREREREGLGNGAHEGIIYRRGKK